MELLVPIIMTAVLGFFAQGWLRKKDRQGYRFGMALSFFSFVTIVAIWLCVGRYLISIQCEAAYGAASSDPRMCDNPANGIMAIFQMPILLLAWIVISGVVIFRLKPIVSKAVNEV